MMVTLGLVFVLLGSSLLDISRGDDGVTVTRADFEKIGERLFSDQVVESEGDWDMNMGYAAELLEKERNKSESEQDKGYLAALELFVPLGQLTSKNICTPDNLKLIEANKHHTVDKRNLQDYFNGDGRVTMIVIHFLDMYKSLCKGPGEEMNPLQRVQVLFNKFNKKD